LQFRVIANWQTGSTSGVQLLHGGAPKCQKGPGPIHLIYAFKSGRPVDIGAILFLISAIIKIIAEVEKRSTFNNLKKQNLI
jgi:hypothetical protein